MSFTARRESSGETDIPDREFADTLSVFVKHQRSNPILMQRLPACRKNQTTAVAMDMYLGFER